MSPTQVVNQAKYASRIFNRWHRPPTMPKSFAANDLDLVAYCWKCNRWLVLYEQTENAEHPIGFHMYGAKLLKIPVVLVFVDYTQRDVVSALVVYDPSGRNEGRRLSRGGIIRYEKFLREEHKKVCAA